MVYVAQFPALSFFKDYVLPSVDNTKRVNYQSHLRIENDVHDWLFVLNNEHPLNLVLAESLKQKQLPILVHQKIFYIFFGKNAFYVAKFFHFY